LDSGLGKEFVVVYVRVEAGKTVAMLALRVGGDHHALVLRGVWRALE
jgi:hypothetical protein